jgi:hypothetical protein
MGISFLDYYKTILQKVSFDQQLFRKELKKAMTTLDPNEATELRHWLISRGLFHNPVDEMTLPVGHTTFGQYQSPRV